MLRLPSELELFESQGALINPALCQPAPVETPLVCRVHCAESVLVDAPIQLVTLADHGFHSVEGVDERLFECANA